MPPQMRAGLQQTIQRMPVQKQEQYLAEMIAQSKRREKMNPAEASAEDEEMRELHESFAAIVESMDPMQR